MSTVDAAIIDYIVKGGSSGGGSSGGGGGSVTTSSNEIVFNKDTNPADAIIKYVDTRTIADGYLAIGCKDAFTEQRMLVYMDGRVKISGDMTAPNIYTKDEVDTLVSSSGGSSGGGGGEDVGVKLEGTYIQSSSLNKLYVKNIASEHYLTTGMLLNLKHLASGAIHKFVLVRFRYTNADKPADAKDGENVFMALTEGVDSLPAKIYSDDGNTYTIQIDGVQDGTYSSLDSASQFMTPAQISGRTLGIILQGQSGYFIQLNDLLAYLEKTVETLKQKAGL